MAIDRQEVTMADLADREEQVLAPEDLPPIATPTQLAKAVQTTVDALAQDRYRRRGIPHVKIGGRVRYLRADVL
jgi:hypothetical protein